MYNGAGHLTVMIHDSCDGNFLYFFVVDIFNFQLAHIRSKNAKKSLTNY